MSTESSGSAANKTIVDEYLKAYSTGNIAEIARHLHEEVTWWVAGTVPGISGTYNKAQTLALLGQVTTIYKKRALQITPSRMISEGRLVAVEAESYAELHNGKIYNNLYHFLFEIEDGKIKCIREYLDTQHVHDTFVSED